MSLGQRAESARVTERAVSSRSLSENHPAIKTFGFDTSCATQFLEVTFPKLYFDEKNDSN